MPDENATIICLECPVGYVGAACELCADGYYGNPTGIGGPVQACQACDCNGNVDLNAVGNCNRTTGDCLKCIHNTAGPHCDQCLPGFFGDPFASPHGQCEQCSCYPRGTEQTDNGVNMCDQQTGNCHCKANVIGRDCNECKNGYWNIMSGNGCESCNCDPIGSYNSTCDTFTGQCRCKPGVTGKKCDQCQEYQYGFSVDGCKPCDCDPSGSRGFQCDQNGQCLCNDNVEGLRCDRCKENTYDRNQGCIDCPDCYNLVQDAVNAHRTKLEQLKSTLREITNNPTVSDDAEFESKLKITQEKVDILLEDAKAGAGGGDVTLVEKVNELHEKIEKVADILNEAERLQDDTAGQIEETSKTAKAIEGTIALANQELTTAMELLKTDGANALQRAKDRSAQFDNQSKEISDISRDARHYADKLEAEAEEARLTAKEALDIASKALDIAKNTNNLQQMINADLKQNVSTEINDFRFKIETVKRITDDALEKATEVYDEALTLFANINSLAIPEVDVATIKADADRLIEDSERILRDLDEIVISHKGLLEEANLNIDFAKTLIERVVAQKEDALLKLEDVEASHKKAEDAVKRGSKTLKEANETYHVLTEFHDKIQESKANAEIALNSIGSIEEKISVAGGLVDKAENALDGANSNAEDARKYAQEAQEKYAEQASSEAEAIRLKANETKFAARDLRSEADNLNQRVGKTEERMGILESAASKDDGLTKEAKDKVGQASADALEAQKQVERALKDVKGIMYELDNLRDIDVDDLNRLEEKLIMAEEELKRVKLDDRLETLNELKNHQNQMIKSYNKEISQLEADVNNIRAIADALPTGCFKRTRLEP